MSLSDEFGITFCIVNWRHNIESDLHKNGDLCGSVVHRLNLVLNLECIVLGEVDVG